MKTRLISFLLLLALVVTAMPLVSFAAENEETAVMEEADYNALYVQDGLLLSIDFFKLNEYWNPDADYGSELPLGPADNKNYYDATTDAYYDFTVRDNRFEYTVTKTVDENVTEVGTYLGLAAATEAINALNAANTEGATYAAVKVNGTEDRSEGKLHAAWDRAVDAWFSQDLDFFLGFTNYRARTTGAANLILKFNTANSSFDTHSSSSRDNFARSAVGTLGNGYITMPADKKMYGSSGLYLSGTSKGEIKTYEVVSELGDNIKDSYLLMNGIYAQITKDTANKTFYIKGTSNTYVKFGEFEVQKPVPYNTLSTFSYTMDGEYFEMYDGAEKLLRVGYTAGTSGIGAGSYFDYGNSLIEAKLYAARYYSVVLDVDQRAQNHFADIAKWFKLDVANFKAVRDDYGPKALNEYYAAFADYDFNSDRDEVQSVANAAFVALITEPEYPEIPLDAYNALYVQDGLTTAFDVMALNKYWGNAVASFPTSPMLNENYEYPKNSGDYYNFKECEDGYYVDRFTGDEDATVFTYIKCKEDMTTATDKTEAGNLHSHVSSTKYTLAEAKAEVARLNALDDGYVYYVVGETTSAAYKQAIIDYDKDVDEWLESYTWAGIAPSVQVDYINFATAPDKQLRDSFKAYAPFLDPVAGQGYLHTQYTYCGDSGIYYTPPAIPENGGDTTVEMVTRVGAPASYLFIFLYNQRLNLATSASGSKITSITNFTSDEGATVRNSNALDRTKVDTLRFTLSVDAGSKKTTTTTNANGKETTTVTYTGSPLVEQGNTELYYASAGTYKYTASNMIGYDNTLTNSRIYSLRVYNDELTPYEKAQNHFADIAKWYRLDITCLDSFSDDEKLRVYEAFADCTVDSKSRSYMLEIYDAIIEEIVLEKFEKVLEFKGYQAKISGMPGLRSTYSIDKTVIADIEAYGKNIIVGAIMALATDERNEHEDLLAPTSDGVYDRSAYDDYSYISNGTAYQEIYSTEDGGFVGNLTKTTDTLCEFAFTTIYSEANQTAENFEKALVYRGFVVILDKDGNTEEIIYADMSSGTFDDDGDSISIYELSDYFYENPEDLEGQDDAMIKLVVDKVDTAPKSYYDLYYQDNLIYHLNFASAKEGTAIVGGENYDDPDALAKERFGAAASNYVPYYAFRREGLEYPVSGGTATVTGGWKFLTPFKYDYWFDAEGNLTTGRAGALSTADHFVTEEGVAGAPYYMKNGAYVKESPTRVIGGQTYTLYTLIHTAPENATGYYITGTVWGAVTYSSAFGNGYINFGNGNVPNILNSLTAINKEMKYTVDLTASIPANGYTSLFIGVPYCINNAKGIYYQGLTNSYIVDSTTNFTDVALTDMRVENVNTYSFTVDATDIANKNVKLGFYGNGASYGTQDLIAPEASLATSSWQYAMRNAGTKTYAIRVYDAVLSAEQVLQNHFADVAIFNALNVKEFRTLTDEQKRDVYEAFKTVTVDSAEDLQTMLDTAVAAAKAE